MQYRQNFQIRSSGNPFGFVGGILLAVLFFVAIFYITKSLFTLLAYAAPVLLILTLIIDYKVVTNYLRWIFQLLKSNAIAGIGMILLTVFGFPFVTTYLFAKSLVKRKINRMHREYEVRTKGELIDFEEIESRPHEQPPVELPKILPRDKEKLPNNPYDRLFEE